MIIRLFIFSVILGIGGFVVWQKAHNFLTVLDSKKQTVISEATKNVLSQTDTQKNGSESRDEQIENELPLSSVVASIEQTIGTSQTLVDQLKQFPQAQVEALRRELCNP